MYKTCSYTPCSLPKGPPRPREGPVKVQCLCSLPLGLPSCPSSSPPPWGSHPSPFSLAIHSDPSQLRSAHPAALSRFPKESPTLVIAPKAFGVLASPKNLSVSSPPSFKEVGWIHTALGDSGSVLGVRTIVVACVQIRFLPPWACVLLLLADSVYFESGLAL